MLFEKQPRGEREHYESMLISVCSLSRLFSESDVPYLDSRMAENIFCDVFHAKNVSRHDSSADAVLKDVGIGIKTFQGGDSQKVAEFNKHLSLFQNLDDKEKIKKIAELRNERLEVTKRIYGINTLIYHCIRRDKGVIQIYEYPMALIDIKSIKSIKRKENIITFSDSINEYSFNISKSVLSQKFTRANKPLLKVKIQPISDPFSLIHKLSLKNLAKQPEDKPFIILPLFAFKKGGEKIVPPKSGLNQWNAEGRRRDPDETYIPIPAWIKNKFVGFFPARDVPFKLNLPNDKSISAKVCQQNDKALMSNPNKDLGKWILRDILQLKQKELATYAKLKKIGIDSVIVKKLSAKEYSIDFREEGAFEEFIENNK